MFAIIFQAIQSLSATFPAIVWVASGATVLTMADLAFRHATLIQNHWFFFAAWAGYILGGFLIMQTFFMQNIAVYSIIAIALNTVTYVLAAWYLFNETLNTLQILGIILGLISVVILHFA